jgi:asparagine synthase (glutamine-hydrolysing)
MYAIAGMMSAKDQAEKFTAGINQMKHRGREQIVYRQLGNQWLRVAEFGRGISSPDSDLEEMGFPFIVFSGKLSNREDLKNRLRNKKPENLSADRSLILALYEEQGEEFISLLEGSFAFAIFDQEKGWLIARDSLGRMPLYISTSQDPFCFASEMKTIREMTPDFIEFPSGSFYTPERGFRETQRRIKKRGTVIKGSGEEQMAEIRRLLLQSTETMMDGEESVGVYLSGGLDSSIIAALASEKRPGIPTFSVGIKGSADLKHARLCRDFIGSSHQEYIYTKEEMLEVLPEVIRQLESYDAGLVRSAVANYFLARISSGHIRTALSGEGADELFLGYDYLLKLPPDQLEGESERLLESLHNTGLQRGDRMSAAFGIQALTPFLDEGFFEMALQIPAAVRQMEGKPEKWMLKEAFQGLIPDEIRNRKKNKFSVGAGSSRLISQVANEKISDKEWEEERVTLSGHPLISKEELVYYRIFREYFPELACDKAVGHTRHL